MVIGAYTVIVAGCGIVVWQLYRLGNYIYWEYREAKFWRKVENMIKECNEEIREKEIMASVTPKDTDHD